MRVGLILRVGSYSGWAHTRGGLILGCELLLRAGLPFRVGLLLTPAHGLHFSSLAAADRLRLQCGPPRPGESEARGLGGRNGTDTSCSLPHDVRDLLDSLGRSLSS